MAVERQPGGLGARAWHARLVPVVEILDHRDRDLAVRIRDLQRAAYGVEAELIGFSGIPPLNEEVADIVELALTVLGTVEHGEILGLLGYCRVGSVVDIDRLAVEPSHFRRGIGRLLLEDLHRREVGAARFEVSTGTANYPALALYEVMGYRRIGEDPSSVVRIVRLARQGGG